MIQFHDKVKEFIVMRCATIAVAALLSLGSASVLAQSSSNIDSTTGARPGHVAGVGDSLPRSDKASNITSTDTRSSIAPTLPSSSVGAGATIRDYLRSARESLVAGKTGATQQSLEMAETRALDRSVPAGQTEVPDPDKVVSWIRQARQAMSQGDNRHAIQIIEMALSS